MIESLEPLSEMTFLSSLDLSGNPVSDLTPLSEMSSLSSLYLSTTSVSDLTPLYNLAGLSYVSVYDSFCSDTEIEAFKEVLPDCDIY
jgi:internalin A